VSRPLIRGNTTEIIMPLETPGPTARAELLRRIREEYPAGKLVGTVTLAHSYGLGYTRVTGCMDAATWRANDAKIAD
jgi:hypothetical protein